MTPAAPPVRAARPSRLRAARTPLLLAGGAAVVVAGLLLVDPHEPGSWGVCPVYALTGRYCAGCGVLRASRDLLTGDLAGAWAMNPLWVLAVPVLALLWARALARSWRTGAPPAAPPAWVAVAGLALVAVYSVARNVPAWAPALAPGAAG